MQNFPILVKKTEERIKLFERNPTDSILKDHPLKGSMHNYRSFSVSGDIRILYRKINNKGIFYDIGSHNQVY